MKFRKKPIVIEAVRYLPHGNCNEIKEFVGDGAVCDATGESDAPFLIETLEGTMQAAPGDWIIKGVAGEFYPCKPDIFDATYEPA